MPIYEYACKHCQSVCEQKHSIKKAPTRAPCNKCGKEAEKIISVGAKAVIKGYSEKNGYSKQ